MTTQDLDACHGIAYRLFGARVECAGLPAVAHGGWRLSR